MTERLVVPFRPWHYAWLANSGSATDRYTVKQIESVAAQLQSQNSWTGVIDGEPLVCAGTMKQWEGRHIAWAYLAQNTGPHMLWITREVKKALAGIEGRIEFTVRADFAAGHRWAEVLGFEVETLLMQGFGPDGAAHTGYVRFN